MSMDQLCTLLQKLSQKIIIIDSNFYKEIARLIDEKKGHLSFLIRHLSGGHLDIKISPKNRNKAILGNQRSHIGPEIVLNSTNRSLISLYLDEMKPRLTIATLEQILQNYKETLMEHFSIKDILCQVKDEGVLNYPSCRFG